MQIYYHLPLVFYLHHKLFLCTCAKKSPPFPRPIFFSLICNLCENEAYSCIHFPQSKVSSDSFMRLALYQRFPVPPVPLFMIYRKNNLVWSLNLVNCIWSHGYWKLERLLALILRQRTIYKIGNKAMSLSQALFEFVYAGSACNYFFGESCQSLANKSG